MGQVYLQRTIARGLECVFLTNRERGRTDHKVPFLYANTTAVGRDKTQAIAMSVPLQLKLSLWLY